MRRFYPLAPLLLLLFSVVSCVPAVIPSTPTEVVTQPVVSQPVVSVTEDVGITPLEAPSTAPTPSPQPALTGTPDIFPDLEAQPLERTQYHILATLDYPRRSLSVEERIIVLNQNGQALDSLVFILEPQRLSPQFQLLELYWEDGSAVDRYVLEDGMLRIPLAQALQPEEHLALGMVFAYLIPSGSAPFGYTNKQINLADWYAFAPAFAGEWLAHPDAPVGEHLVYGLADYKVELRIQEGEAGLVVAAPVPEEPDGEVRRYTRTQARNFTLSISPDYVLLQDASAAVRAFVFPEHTASGEAALGCVRQALELYTQLYGDPALPMMNVVETDFPDGMEYDGLFFLNYQYFEYPGSGAIGGLCTLSAHETAHQWWYRLVGSDTALEPWLDESLCTFSELLFYEYLHPDAVNWWWGYRVNDYNPQGWVNSNIYEFDNYRPYVNAVYLRGVRFLDALRRTAGDQAMLDFLAAYAQANRFGQADADSFFTIWQDTTGVDIETIREAYFK